MSAPPPPQSSSHDAPGACICVVDDDAAVRRAMANLLEAGGYRCLGFASGEALLAWPSLAAIDVAIFDVQLRGMDGFALQRRCAERGMRAPLIFFSGHGDAGTEQRALRAGALALLRKPVDPDQLLDQVERALERTPEHSPEYPPEHPPEPAPGQTPAPRGPAP